MEQVEPPSKGAGESRFDGEARMSEALRGASASTRSLAERESRSCAFMKCRSAFRKAWVRIAGVEAAEAGSVKKGGRKRRKYPPTVFCHDFIRADWRIDATCSGVCFVPLRLGFGGGVGVLKQDPVSSFSSSAESLPFSFADCKEGSSLFGPPKPLVLPPRLDSSPYAWAASSMYSCNFSLKNPLHSVPPCPSNTPK